VIVAVSIITTLDKPLADPRGEGKNPRAQTGRNVASRGCASFRTA
jgi:hypothetical protein